MPAIRSLAILAKQRLAERASDVCDAYTLFAHNNCKQNKFNDIFVMSLKNSYWLLATNSKQTINVSHAADYQNKKLSNRLETGRQQRISL